MSRSLMSGTRRRSARRAACWRVTSIARTDWTKGSRSASTWTSSAASAGAASFAKSGTSRLTSSSKATFQNRSRVSSEFHSLWKWSRRLGHAISGTSLSAANVCLRCASSNSSRSTAKSCSALCGNAMLPRPRIGLGTDSRTPALTISVTIAASPGDISISASLSRNDLAASIFAARRRSTPSRRIRLPSPATFSSQSRSRS